MRSPIFGTIAPAASITFFSAVADSAPISVFPLIAQNRVIGVLSFYSREERRYGEEEKSFLRSLAGQAAVAIHNSELYEQIHRQAAALEKANQVRRRFPERHVA